MVRHKRIYGRRWQKIRADILARDEMMCQCAQCKGVKLIAHEVDHIVPLNKGGTNEYDNLQALNEACHKIKTRRDLGFKKKFSFGEDGLPTGIF